MRKSAWTPALSRKSTRLTSSTTSVGRARRAADGRLPVGDRREVELADDLDDTERLASSVPRAVGTARSRSRRARGGSRGGRRAPRRCEGRVRDSAARRPSRSTCPGRAPRAGCRCGTARPRRSRRACLAAPDARWRLRRAPRPRARCRRRSGRGTSSSPSQHPEVGAHAREARRDAAATERSECRDLRVAISLMRAKMFPALSTRQTDAAARRFRGSAAEVSALRTAERSRAMPPRGVKKGTKRARQYEHIKESLEEQGRSEGVAEEIAARTVNKERARHGEARESSRLSRTDISSGRRGGLRSRTARGRAAGRRRSSTKRPSASASPGARR